MVQSNISIAFYFNNIRVYIDIILIVLAAQFPTIVVYIMDTVRSTNPVTFMSNMLYACSILYKTKLPFIVAMNKVDVVDNKYAVEWMEDFDVFQVCRTYLTDKSNILLRIKV